MDEQVVKAALSYAHPRGCTTACIVQKQYSSKLNLCTLAESRRLVYGVQGHRLSRVFLCVLCLRLGTQHAHKLQYYRKALWCTTVVRTCKLSLCKNCFPW